MITGFDHLTTGGFMESSSMGDFDGHVVLQTIIMREIMKNSITASQTDTIEGFVVDPRLPNIKL